MSNYTGKEPRKTSGSSGGGYNDEGMSVQETAAVFANFEFLTNQEMDMDEIDDLDAKQTLHASGKQGNSIFSWSVILYTSMRQFRNFQSGFSLSAI